MTQKRMELWSDDKLPEFSIKFESSVVATTSNPEVMIKMIDECPYKEGYDFDWHYTLSQWIVYYLANKFTVLINSKVPMQKDFRFRTMKMMKLTLVYTLVILLQLR